MTWVPKTVVVSLVVAAGLTAGTAGSAAAASTATLGDVVCADGQGSVTITLTADAANDINFFYDVVGDIYSGGTVAEDSVVVAAGQSKDVTVDDIDDGEYQVFVFAENADASDGEVLDEAITVACDPAPEGPYTNARGAIEQTCGTAVTAHGANRPIGGNTEDLQSAAYVLALKQGEQETTLAEFVLPDEVDDPYTTSVTVDLLDFGIDPYDGIDAGDPDLPVDDGGVEDGSSEDGEEPAEPRITAEADLVLTLTANGTLLREEPFYLCIASPTTGEGGPAVVNTGA